MEKQYIIKTVKSVVCVNCNKNIFSASHNCPVITTNWIDVSKKSKTKKYTDIRKKNILNLLKQNSCKIFRLVETEQEYKRFENSAHIDKNGIMYIELSQKPFVKENKITWITEAIRSRKKPYIPPHRCSTPPGFWNLDIES